jgi:protein O-mannosyl-transferase
MKPDDDSSHSDREGHKRTRPSLRRRAAFFIPMIFGVVLIFTTLTRNNPWHSDILLWTDVISKSPSKARSYCYLGSAYLNEGLTDKAIEHYTIALKLDTFFIEANYSLGVAYKKQRRNDLALTQYFKALDIAPDFEKAHYACGHVYLEMGNVDDARKEFQETLRINPSFREAQVFINYIDNTLSRQHETSIRN